MEATQASDRDSEAEIDGKEKGRAQRQRPRGRPVEETSKIRKHLSRLSGKTTNQKQITSVMSNNDQHTQQRVTEPQRTLGTT